MKKVREVKRAAKVGETIKIVKVKKNWHTPSVYIGDKYVVTEVGFSYKGQYVWTDNLNRFHESDKEYVVLEEYEDENDFTLDDLKPCMVVKTRNEKLYIIVQSLEDVELNGDTGWLRLAQFTIGFDFYKRDEKEWDIIEVYGFSRMKNCANKISTEYRSLLWKRSEKSEAELKIEKLEEKQRQIASEIEEKQRQIASEIEELRKGLK